MFKPNFQITPQIAKSLMRIEAVNHAIIDVNLRQLDSRQKKALGLFQKSDTITAKDISKLFGIAQITKSTLKILQDPEGETKDFIFKKIRQKDLKDPRSPSPLEFVGCTGKSLLQKANLAENRITKKSF